GVRRDPDLPVDLHPDHGLAADDLDALDAADGGARDLDVVPFEQAGDVVERPGQLVAVPEARAEDHLAGGAGEQPGHRHERQRLEHRGGVGAPRRPAPQPAAEPAAEPRAHGRPPSPVRPFAPGVQTSRKIWHRSSGSGLRACAITVPSGPGTRMMSASRRKKPVSPSIITGRFRSSPFTTCARSPPPSMILPRLAPWPRRVVPTFSPSSPLSASS